jgi:2-polyprenyl-3-methyl-5-hydroxy-6-metoxy-1,4-benzoquinol methylase
MKSDIPEFWHLGSYKYPFYFSQLQILLRLYIPKSFLILDASCGPNSGYLTKTPINIQGIGLDISRTNIENSIKMSKEIGKNKLSFIVGDIEKMPFHEDTFDVIICKDVLEHVKCNENAISEIAFSLKREGKIFISTTNALNPAMFIDGILPKNVTERIIRVLGGPHYYERERRLNPWNLRKKLIKHGIRVIKSLMTGFPPIGKPWIYQYSQTKPPKIFHLWIFFNKLTDIHFFENFKEVMIVVAEKFCSSVERDRRASDFQPRKWHTIGSDLEKALLRKGWHESSYSAGGRRHSPC